MRDDTFNLIKDGHFNNIAIILTATYSPAPAEADGWRKHLNRHRHIAAAGLTMRQVREQLLRADTWRKIRSAA